MPSCGFCGESFDNFSQLYQHSPNCPNSSKPDTWLSRFTEEKEEKEEPENPRISSCFQGRDTLIPKSSIILPFGGKIILDQLNSMLSPDNYQDKISYYMNFDDNEFIIISEILVDKIDNTLRFRNKKHNLTGFQTLIESFVVLL